MRREIRLSGVGDGPYGRLDPDLEGMFENSGAAELECSSVWSLPVDTVVSWISQSLEPESNFAEQLAETSKIYASVFKDQPIEVMFEDRINQFVWQPFDFAERSSDQLYANGILHLAIDLNAPDDVQQWVSATEY